MTATSVDSARRERLESNWHEPHGIASLLTTVDHKRIGLRYLYTGFAFFVLGGVEALVMRVQLTRPETRVLSVEAYHQLFSMHGITMMFLFAIPVLSGFGNYLVPLMIGARDMAFPRLNALSYWIFVASGTFMYSSFLIGRAPNDGWFNYVPQASKTFSPGINIDFYALGLIFLGVSTTVGAINFIVTIFKLRAPGMTLNRIPIFVWGELGMAFTVVFALPILSLACVMLLLERRFGFHFFDAAGGGDPLLWQHLFWLFGHPLVYLIVLPGLGIASAIIPTFVRRRMIGYLYIVLAELSIAVIGFGVWAHHMFATGLPQVSMSFVSIASFMITIPSGLQIFAWLATMIAGKPKFRTPLLFVVGFIVIFVIGGLSGVMFAAVPFDQATTDSYFVVAHLHYVLIGGAVFPMFAGIYHWAPKMYGRLLHEGWGKASFWLMFVGFNLAFFPMHITGLNGQPRRVYTYQAGLGWDVWNWLSTIGAFVFAIGVLVSFVNWFVSARRGRRAAPDPWGGETLEWATSSPPPHHNFDVIPDVESLHPMWDQPALRHPPSAPGRPLDTMHATLSTSLLDARPQAIARMPHASPWPFVLTVAMTVLFGGLLVSSAVLAVAGGASCAIAIGGWAWPRDQTQET